MTAGFDRLTAALADRYRLERELGEGGMATVYLAQDLRHERKVAVKVLRAELAAALGPERFLREIKIAANLQHPHIVGVHDSGEADGFLYYVKPFVNGMSLREKLRRDGPLSLAEAARILRDVADALAVAHQNGVVHRDIKPENVMLTGRHAVVTDFGVAKAVSTATGPAQSQTTVGMALGTPAYMAPEQAMADPNVDHRADIYAFGVLAYELLSGRQPFTGDSPQAIVAAHVTQAAAPVTEQRAGIPPALANLVMRCLAKKPSDRPQSAEDLIPVLETALTPSGGVTPAESGARGRPLLWVGLGLVALVLVGFALWRRPTSQGNATGPAVAKSIAVLPLVNVGGDSTQDYYADGVSEELANALGKVKGLRVAARTSAFAFKGRRDLDVSEVGEKLNVGVVLQGTVRRLGDRLRLSVQLTTTKERVELWSESYDQAVKDVFAIQDSITRAIVRQLALALGTSGRAGRARDPEAHDLYLRGLALTNRSTDEESLRTALSYYRRALERDPDYVDAWLGVAYVYWSLADAYQPSSAARDSSRMAARQALDRDSLAGEAYIYLASAAEVVDWNFEEGDQLFHRAIELSPNSSNVHTVYGISSCSIGRADEGLASIARGAELDPLNSYATWARWNCLWASRQYDELLAEQTGHPPNELAAVAARELGRYDEALQTYERIQQGVEAPFAGHAVTYARMGRVKEAREILARLTTYARTHYVNPMFFATVYASLGQKDKTFEWLERAVTERTSNLFALQLLTEFDPIRSDPRYAVLIKRIGLPEAPRR